MTARAGKWRWIAGVLAGVAVVVLAAELSLRVGARLLARSDVQDPGLIVYDAALGWRPRPSWTVRHRHREFDVRYTTDAEGFRRDPAALHAGGPVCAVLGDSFTFGIGVGDGETFCSVLTAACGGRLRCRNFGVPGYSTDQEYLLLGERVLPLRPAAVLLVVYLGNDLLDNPRTWPLQADRAKPRYVLEPGGLRLAAAPEAGAVRPAGVRERSIRDVLLAADPGAAGPLRRRVGNWLLPAALGLDPWDGFDDGRATARVMAGALPLFAALIDAAREACAREGVPLAVVLLPGHAFLSRPRSLQGRFQEIERRGILERLGRDGGPRVLDLAAALEARYREQPGTWYFGREGHLTPEGHRVIAALLLPLVSELTAAPAAGDWSER